jgi:hypothetical protein
MHCCIEAEAAVSAVTCDRGSSRFCFCLDSIVEWGSLRSRPAPYTTGRGAPALPTGAGEHRLGALLERDGVGTALGVLLGWLLPVEQAYPFSQAAEAHRVSQAGHVRGKLVLVPE